MAGMAIPGFQSLILPLLRLAGDGQEHQAQAARDTLANEFGLTDEERSRLLPSGTQRVFVNRVAWARPYLKQAGLLDSPKRGVFVITQRGQETLAEAPQAIDIKYLQRFPAFVEFRKGHRKKSEEDEKERLSEATPEEAVSAAYKTLRSELEGEILNSVKNCSPAFLEKLVVDVLVKMGYGGSLQDAGRAVGRAGDEGIDGIIKEDRLGLGVIYLQAKRWDNTVGRPEIQRFAGALQGKRAQKGVFITTSSFSAEAQEYARRIDTRVVLIDGAELASLMIDHNVGVSTVESYEIKKMDGEYFTED